MRTSLIYLSTRYFSARKNIEPVQVSVQSYQGHYNVHIVYRLHAIFACLLILFPFDIVTWLIVGTVLRNARRYFHNCRALKELQCRIQTLLEQCLFTNSLSLPICQLKLSGVSKDNYKNALACTHTDWCNSIVLSNLAVLRILIRLLYLRTKSLRGTY